jgi:hypothetical protein
VAGWSVELEGRSWWGAVAGLLASSGHPNFKDMSDLKNDIKFLPLW